MITIVTVTRIIITIKIIPVQLASLQASARAPTFGCSSTCSSSIKSWSTFEP